MLDSFLSPSWHGLLEREVHRGPGKGFCRAPGVALARAAQTSPVNPVGLPHPFQNGACLCLCTHRPPNSGLLILLHGVAHDRVLYPHIDHRIDPQEIYSAVSSVAYHRPPSLYPGPGQALPVALPDAAQHPQLCGRPQGQLPRVYQVGQRKGRHVMENSQ